MADRTEKIAEYAFWSVPGSGTVTYSLPLFQEIDFFVNEGYRKIPHGGIEVGGLLFGSLEADSARIEAFRPIECEHASGPSFLLSERDLERLEKQLGATASDPDLKPFQPVGWFLARTRSPLQLSDRELELFNRYFPGPGKVTLLVKPERFQPTRFGFLVRDTGGEVPRDASQQAIILPLSGRAGGASEGPIASIPAPAESAPKRREAPPQEVDRQLETEVPLASPAKRRIDEMVDSAFGDVTERKTEMSDAGRITRERVRAVKEQAGAEPMAPPEEIPPQIPVQVKQPAGPESRTPVLPEPKPPTVHGPVPGAPVRNSTEAGQLAERLDQAHRSLSLPAPSSRPKNGAITRPLTKQASYSPPPPAVAKKPTGFQARYVFAMLLAALLGCVAGYWGYLQLPSPVITLRVQNLSQTMMVSWPPENTRNAIYAAIRIDDGAPVPLSPEEKNSGQIEVSARSNLKIELIARNWLRDSRGIVRYVRAAGVSPHTSPPAQP